MALVLADRVQETTTTSGTGTLTLAGAVAGYRTFGSGIGSGNTTYYCIYDQTTQVWEIGLGTVGSGTLARTTVYSNSSGNTSPLNLAGNTASVFAVYTASKTVNLDASGNVTALGNVTSATWQGSTVGVAYGGTGVTASSGADSVVLRDANQNITANNVFLGFASTVTSGGTTTLTVASAYYQRFTGTSTQTLKLPDATTLSTGRSFLVDNDSTGTLTIINGASGAVDTVIAESIDNLILVDNSTIAGTWIAYGLLPSNYDFSSSIANFGGATLTNGTWQGNVISSAYGGTGLSTFTAANYALYSTSSSALTAGTLPVPAGGTGQTTFASGYIPYGNTTAALQSSNLLQFNGTYLQVGGGSVLGGATNPITAFSQSANNYVQTYTYNPSTGGSGSADFVAYTNNSTDAHGWADMGFTSSTYNDPVYTVTGPNEAYILGSAPANASATGNLVYATDSTGTANSHQWYVGGFTQAKGAWKMQLTSTGLQLANALSTAYGGTGLTTVGTNGQVLTSNGTTLTWTTPTTGTVTSVSGTSPVVSSGGNTPAISLASGYGDTQNPYASKTANYVLAAPNGSAGAPTFRALVAADIPALSYAPTAGSTSITTLGTIGTGTWQGTSISTTYTDAKVTSATAVAGTGISVTSVTTTGAATHTITNTGVTSAAAGTGISVSGSTGGVTFTNTGVTSLAAGNGMSVSGSTGAVTITATGATLNSQAGAYTLVAGDAGKIVANTTGGFVVNNSVFSAGNIVTLYNNSGSNQTITQGTGVTLQWAGQSSSTTGNRTLGLYGIATIVFLSASSAVITGSGLT